MPRAALLVVLLGISCSGGRSATRNELSPGIVFPTALGEGHGDGPGEGEPAASPVSSASAAASASSTPAQVPAPAAGGTASSVPPSASASAARSSAPPDPEPLRMAEQWEYQLAYEGGQVVVRATEPRRFAAPVVSARRFGRFAIELWIGKELIERVRFDFPGLGDEPAPAPAAQRTPLYKPTDLSKGLHAMQKVLVPAAPRARRAVLVDRATGEVRALPWPPDHPLPEPSSEPAAPGAAE